MTNPADLEHPCKETCSGWKQGYERGQSDAQMEEANNRLDQEWPIYKQLEAERAKVAELEEMNRYRVGQGVKLHDMKMKCMAFESLYAAERTKVKRAMNVLKSAREIILWSIDQRSLHTMEQIDECLRAEAGEAKDGV